MNYLYPGLGNKTYLTKGGNILLCDVNGRYSFHNPDLEFIREVSESEGNYILSNNPTEITVQCKLHSQFANYCIGLGEFPTWHFVKSILVVQNNSNFCPETSCNGGNYSFHTYHDWYVAKYPNGEWKFAYVERHSSSAEFSFDELAGNFQSDLGFLYLSNVEKGETFMLSKYGEETYYQSQAGIEWVNREKFYTSSEVLEKIATMSSFEDMWNEEYEFIPSRWDDDEEGYVGKALSFSDKKQIVTRLKELGVTKQELKLSLRGQRRNGRR